MSRTRLIRPGFIKDADLYQAEVAWQLPLRAAFAGLWGVTDREGRFPWKPMELKPDALPYDNVDYLAVLEAFEAEGFVQRYLVDGRLIGVIPSFKDHQTFHKSEPDSKLPAPVGAPLAPRLSPRVLTVNPPEDTDTDTDADAIAVADTDSGTNYSVPAVAAPERNEVFQAIRAHLYAPDGTPPTGWEESRDGSILKALRANGYSTPDIIAAIEGVAVLRDFPGKFGEVVDWLKPGDKATLKALYNTRTGVRPLFGVAIDAYYRRANLSADRESSRQPTKIAALVPRSA